MAILEPLGLPEDAELLRERAVQHIRGLRAVLEDLGMIDLRCPLPDQRSDTIVTYSVVLSNIRIWIDNILNK
jgi:hypothetical protein